jgi:hypothetical protein
MNTHSTVYWRSLRIRRTNGLLQWRIFCAKICCKIRSGYFPLEYAIAKNLSFRWFNSMQTVAHWGKPCASYSQEYPALSNMYTFAMLSELWSELFHFFCLPLLEKYYYLCWIPGSSENHLWEFQQKGNYLQVPRISKRMLHNDDLICRK